MPFGPVKPFKSVSTPTCCNACFYLSSSHAGWCDLRNPKTNAQKKWAVETRPFGREASIVTRSRGRRKQFPCLFFDGAGPSAESPKSLVAGYPAFNDFIDPARWIPHATRTRTPTADFNKFQ
ncbi:hypothetical protein [Polaromonas sp. YR568]|uniref:hypothetical protein n=1 Tax=Polaromonas sp. YR568 TaxID=1855301 RepID=UPI00313822F8